jgi:hypothetical protein
MLRDTAAWKAWEKAYRKSNPPDLMSNLHMYELLYAQALSLGILPPTDPLAGMQEKIDLVEAIHVSTTARNPGSGAG